jgi:hypothetical protein
MAKIVIDTENGELKAAIATIVESVLRALTDVGFCDCSLTDEAMISSDKYIQEFENHKIQIGLFRIFNYAKGLQRELNLLGYDTELFMNEGLYAVCILVNGSEEQARELEAKLRKEGYDTLLLD